MPQAPSILAREGEKIGGNTLTIPGGRPVRAPWTCHAFPRSALLSLHLCELADGTKAVERTVVQHVFQGTGSRLHADHLRRRLLPGLLSNSSSRFRGCHLRSGSLTPSTRRRLHAGVEVELGWTSSFSLFVGRERFFCLSAGSWGAGSRLPSSVRRIANIGTPMPQRTSDLGAVRTDPMGLLARFQMKL